MAMQQTAARKKLYKAVTRKKASRWPSRFSVRKLKVNARSRNINNDVIPYARLCSEIAEELFNKKLLFEEEAIEAIQAATEDMIIPLMQGAALMCSHAGRTTVKKEDFEVFQAVICTMRSPVDRRNNLIAESSEEQVEGQCIVQ
ncbi:hypothetical protein FPOA_07085 [Fusarium poae]|uniref:Core Histone H2A/H2B/H3 domain-containing protein n=1 Tax=Fusarium poae TaxID=36050 RepID=A0A1B8AJJ6_FUSPO|nr:hypothetical protein FPOA_07085 [Fusarium poae]